MDGDEEDMHLCLVCQVTIAGLVNYIHHKKSECPGRKGATPTPLTTVKCPALTTSHQQFDLLQPVKNNQNYGEMFNPVAAQPSQIIENKPVKTVPFHNPNSSETDMDYGILGPHGADVVEDEDSVQSQIDEAWKTLESSINSNDASDNHSQVTESPNLDQELFCSPSSSSQSNYNNTDLSTALNISPNFPMSRNVLNISNSSAHSTCSTNTRPSQSQVTDQSTQLTDIQSSFSPPNFNRMSSGKSPIGTTSVNINEIISDHKGHDAHYPSASEKVDDFFLSLELRSRAKAQKLEKNQPELPISNILNNLTFSSDDEELGFNFADDVSLDGFSDDSSNGETVAPPSSHTGGKWRPGEGPTQLRSRGRTPTRGKWPPGEAPKKQRGRYARRPKGGKWKPGMHKVNKPKSSTKTATKEYSCNICNITFVNRFAYSCHCGSQYHKVNVFGKESMERRLSGQAKDRSGPEEVRGGVDGENPEMEESKWRGRGKGKSIRMYRPSEVPVEDIYDGDTEDEADHQIKPAESKTDFSPEKSDIPTNNSDDVANSTENNKVIAVDVSHSGTGILDNGNAPHETQADNITVRHVCMICDKKYHNKYVLARHMLTKFHQNRTIQHTNTIVLLEKYHKYIVRLSPFQCEICRFYFNTNSTFQKHLKSEAHASNCGDLVGEICCSLCNSKFDSNSELLMHTESEEHLSRVMKHNKICIVKESHVQCLCKYCGISLTSFTRLKHHIQIKHSDGQIVEGVVKRKVGVVRRPKCPYCRKECLSYSAMNLHVRRRHTQEKPYRCELCNADFSDRYALETHFKTSKHLRCAIESQDGKDFKSRFKTRINEECEKGEHSLKRKKYCKEKSLSANKVIKVEKSETNNVNVEDVPTSEGLGLDEAHGDARNVEHSSTQCGGGTDSNKVEVQQVNRVDSDVTQFLSGLDDSGIAVDNKGGDIETDSDGNGDDSVSLVDKTKSWSFKDMAGNWIHRVSKPRVKRNKKEKNKAYKCDHCSFVAESYNDLRPHYLLEHSSKIKLCEPCDMIFLSQKALCLHALSSSHQKNLSRSAADSKVILHQCMVCKKRFTDEKYCQFHTAFKHHHLNSEDAILKEYKGKDLTRVKYGHLLEAVEHLDGRVDVKCTECPSTVKKAGYIEHLRTHSGDTPFKCKLCPKSFISSVTLRRHLLGHFACQDNTCDVCGKDFKKLSTYQVHMDRHRKEKSGEQKTYVCDICGQSFFTGTTLAVHRRRHGKKTFVCPYEGCYWSFVFRTELKHHLMSHTQERPYLCDMCGYATTTKSRLKRHSTTHSGERKHHCEYCTYKAGNATHLRRHMRIHIGAKPYICPYCNYSCNTHENMRKHISETKKHDGLKVYPCRFCDFGTNTSKEFRPHLLKCHTDLLEMGRLGSLTELTGLYHKDLDPRQPLEGKKIIQAKERAPRNSKPGQKPKKPKSAGSPALQTACFNENNNSLNSPEDNSRHLNLDAHTKPRNNRKKSMQNKKSTGGSRSPIPGANRSYPTENRPDSLNDTSDILKPYSERTKFVNRDINDALNMSVSVDVTDGSVNYTEAHMAETTSQKLLFRNIGQIPALMVPAHQAASTVASQHTTSQSLFQPHSLVEDPRREISTSLLHVLQNQASQDIAIDPLPRNLIPTQSFVGHPFQKTSFAESLSHNQSKYDNTRGQSKYDNTRGHIYPGNQGRPVNHNRSVAHRNNADFQPQVSDGVYPSNSRSHEHENIVYERYTGNQRNRNVSHDTDTDNLVIDMTYIENT